MNALALDSLLAPVRDIARRAAQEILKVYNSDDFGIADKQDNSPLTKADLAAHTTICEGLSRLTPDIPILSEESVAVPFAERSKWVRYWLVDPLDGTKEFIKRNGEFTVNIALIDGHDVALGVVHIPVSDTCYYAAAGRGAFKLEATGTPVELRTRALRPANITVVGSRSHGGETLTAFTAKLPGDVSLISQGSSIKLCLVAEGKADIYPRFGPTSEWDTAAAQCVVEQAGGAVTDLSFNPIQYNAKEDILNPHFLVIGDNTFEWAKYL
jgi:3'(2'), 5'-bisphosphate nucleotidase